MTGAGEEHPKPSWEVMKCGRKGFFDEGDSPYPIEGCITVEEYVRQKKAGLI